MKEKLKMQIQMQCTYIANKHKHKYKHKNTQLKIGYIFCSAHRFADSHECDYDYQAEHKKKLETMNEVVAPSKLNKI